MDDKNEYIFFTQILVRFLQCIKIMSGKQKLFSWGLFLMEFFLHQHLERVRLIGVHFFFDSDFTKFAIQSSKKHSSSSKVIYVIRSDKKKQRCKLLSSWQSRLQTYEVSFPWDKIYLHIYLLHRKVGDTFHTGNNFRKRCGVKSTTTTAISLFFGIYICVQ